ncbi:MAG: biotin--[acetyl-CoA-carboxylase] ligase [Bacteroidales bacterium]|nr:biotin--[acetyl-CoA-carboxylase] ligase [Bacteroidales bacterium]
MKITHFKTLESTNQYLQNLLNEGADIADNIVVTDFQTSGKGQGKNVWESEDGKNLLFSIALDMSFLKAENQFLLTQMVSVAMINVLKKYLPEESLFIKWPNDIYFNDKKIAGILIKNEIKGMMMGTSIIGIGLNVNQTSFDENLPNPISMKMITGKDYDLYELLSSISQQLSANSQQPTTNSQQPTANSYIKHLYRYQQWALYEHEGQVKEMIITGYDRFGRLILKEKNDLEVVCDLKEIAFV